MKVLKSLRKPEYVFRPAQIVRRLMRELGDAPQTADVDLPWGLRIRVRPGETIGSCIWRMGLYDLCVSECLWRLLDEGEIALDVGANIGHMTSIMGLATGAGGKVFGFEPHPEIFEELKHNASSWEKLSGFAPLNLVNAAVSRESGSAVLHMPPMFTSNRGTASLEGDGVSRAGERNYDVRLTSLDEMFMGTSIGVIKIDVEGHELGVLEGARHLLEMRAIKDIIFEEHRVPPTPVTEYLERFGYRIFRLESDLLRPKAVLPSSTHERRKDAPNFLATADFQRAFARLKPCGWEVLKYRPMAFR